MSITNVITKITVDMAGDVKRFAVKAKQYDRATRVIVVSLLWDEVPYVLDNADTVRCNVHKPDGTIAIIEGDNIAVSGNTVTITLPGTALTAAGRAWADIEIETQDESQQVSCQCFEIDIAKSPVDDDSIISTNEFSAMKLATKAANDAAAAATAEIAATAAAGTAASQAAAAAQAATDAANQAAAAATASIQIDTTLTDNTKAAPAGMVGQIKEDLSAKVDANVLPTITITGEVNGHWDKTGSTLRWNEGNGYCKYTNLIPCIEGDVFRYVGRGWTNANVAIMRDENICISFDGLTPIVEHYITIPSGCAYVMFQTWASAEGATYLEVERVSPITYTSVCGNTGEADGTTWTKTPYGGKWEKSETYEFLKYLAGADSDYIKYIKMPYGANGYYSVDNSKLKHNNTGVIRAMSTNRIRCEAGWKFSYIGASNSSAKAAFFFADKTTNTVLSVVESGSVITVPDGAKYAMFQSYSEDYLTVNLIDPARVANKAPLKGLKWSAIGDSITALRSGAVVWATLFAQNDGVDMNNMGVGYTGFKATTSAGNDNYIARISEIPADVELITVSGSFNDLQHGYSLGTIDDEDDSTIAGCMNLFFTALLEAFPAVPIGVYTTGPWQGLHSGVANSDNYVAMLEAMAKKYGIPFYSIYDKTNLRPWVTGNRTVYYGGNDGVHPNSAGHKLMYAAYKPFIESLVYPKDI